MIEKFQDWMLKQDIHDVAYWLTIILYTSIMIICLGINAIIFNNWYMVVLGSFVMNYIRCFSGGAHASTLEGCIVLTNLLFILFGFLAKITINFYLVWLLALASILLIYIKTPIILTDYLYESQYWHKTRTLIICSGFLLYSCIIYNLNSLLSTAVMWSIIMVGMLMRKNDVVNKGVILRLF